MSAAAPPPPEDDPGADPQPGSGGLPGDPPYRPRPGDELVEPLFGALRREPDGEAAAQPPPPSRGGAERARRGSTGAGWLARLRALLPARRPRPSGDWFVCPVCGAEVAAGARACRECGSDDTTGWSAATQYDDLDLPDPPSNVIPDTFEEFTGAAPRGSAGPRRPSRLLLWLLALSLGLVVARALMALLARA